MNIKILFTILVFCGLMILYTVRKCTSNFNGTYVSNNTEPILEGPSGIDTLTLFDDGSFENKAWGKGKYKINGDRIDFSYDYEFGRAGYSTSISQGMFFGTPKIMLFRDLDFYYEKIE